MPPSNEGPNPYAPAASRVPADTPPGIGDRRIRAHGGCAVVVDPSVPLPRVCLKCGGVSEVLPRLHHIAVDGRRDTAARLQRMQRLTLVAAILVVIPATLIGLMRYFIPVAIVGATVVGCLHHFQTRMSFDVPLCAPCHRRWQNAIRARAVGLTGIVSGAVALSMGTWLGVALIVLSVALIATTRIARRILGGCILADGTSLMLFGLDPTAAQAFPATNVVSSVGNARPSTVS